MQTLTVTQNEAGQRLDKLLTKYLNQAGKGFIYKMMRKKNITLNGKKCDGSERLEEGDQVKLFLSDETIEKFSVPDMGGYEKQPGDQSSTGASSHEKREKARGKGGEHQLSRSILGQISNKDLKACKALFLRRKGGGIRLLAYVHGAQQVLLTDVAIGNWLAIEPMVKEIQGD